MALSDYCRPPVLTGDQSVDGPLNTSYLGCVKAYNDAFPTAQSSTPDHFFDISPTDAYYMGMAGEKWTGEQANTKWAEAMSEAAQAMAEGNLQLAAEKQQSANYWQGISASISREGNQTNQFEAETNRATGMGNLALATNQFLMDKASRPEDLFSLYYLQRGVTPDWQSIKSGQANGDAIVPVNPMTAYKPATAAPDFTQPLQGVASPPGSSTGGSGGSSPTNYAMYVDRNPAGKQGGVPLANLRPGMNLSTVGGDTTWDASYSDAYYDVGKTKKVNPGDVISGGTKIWVDYNPTPAAPAAPAAPASSTTPPAMAMGGWTSGDSFGRFIAGDSLTGRPNEEMIQLSPGASARVVPLDPAHRQMAAQVKANAMPFSRPMPRFALGTEGVSYTQALVPDGMGGWYTDGSKTNKIGGGAPPTNNGYQDLAIAKGLLEQPQRPAVGGMPQQKPMGGYGDPSMNRPQRPGQPMAPAQNYSQPAMGGRQGGWNHQQWGSFLPQGMQQWRPQQQAFSPVGGDVRFGAANTQMGSGGGMQYQPAVRLQNPGMQWTAASQQVAKPTPQFALGTDASQQYADAGMGGQWMNSSDNPYAAGKQLSPNLQTHINNGMPIPPSIIDALSGGITPTADMGKVFSARGIGNMPSLQAINRMTQGEQQALKGYLQSSAMGNSIPFGDFLDFLQKPTQNLQSAQRARMAG